MPVVVAGAVVDRDRVLIAQRAAPAELAGQWELPGGKVDAGESEAHALCRELREEVGITVAVGTRVGEDITGAGPGKNLTLRAYSATLLAGEPYPHEHLALRWVDADELDAVDWVAADRAWLPALRALLGRC